MGTEHSLVLSELAGGAEWATRKAQMTKFQGPVLCYFEMIGEKLLINCSVLSEAHLALISFPVLLG